MKVIFFGDVFSGVGRNVIKKYLPILKKKYNANVIIANGENVSNGRGINSAHYEFLLDVGVDVITLGNHFLARREEKSFYDEGVAMVRPYNIHPNAWGEGSRVFNINGFTFRVTNLLGRILLNELMPSNPFEALEKIIDETQPMIHIVDFHAEATAEKLALGWDFDGRVSAVIGTHTHVQTADERILPEGTGYISDVGMNGAYNGIIGAKRQMSIYRAKTGLPARFEVEEGEEQLSAVYLEFDTSNFKCIKIERIQITPDRPFEETIDE